VVGGYDTLLMQMKLASGAAGQFFGCYTVKVEEETPLGVTAYGNRGTLTVAPGRIHVYTSDGATRTVKTDRKERGYEGEWANFYAAIRGRQAVVSTPYEAYRDLLVIDAALQSAASGRSVKLTPAAIAAEL
jgi:predicted dehydrogenase